MRTKFKYRKLKKRKKNIKKNYRNKVIELEKCIKEEKVKEKYKK